MELIYITKLQRQLQNIKNVINHKLYLLSKSSKISLTRMNQIVTHWKMKTSEH